MSTLNSTRDMNLSTAIDSKRECIDDYYDNIDSKRKCIDDYYDNLDGALKYVSPSNPSFQPVVPSLLGPPAPSSVPPHSPVAVSTSISFSDLASVPPHPPFVVSTSVFPLSLASVPPHPWVMTL